MTATVPILLVPELVRYSPIVPTPEYWAAIQTADRLVLYVSVMVAVPEPPAKALQISTFAPVGWTAFRYV